ncbi:MAG: nucleotidyltransferase domain-containing protein [Candidatus Lokiarchaeota archaeon]|nr:nucleotidyltransferase domain-containing protein [Candidatus Lokiarchaeota archaeon]
MVKDKLLNQIADDFSEIIKNKKILGILLYGSYVEERNTNRSDIDICVVAPNEDIYELISHLLQNINVNAKKYDIRVFNELPLYIKIHVIQTGILIYSSNKLDLYEYFYIYRKLWDDQKHRQEISKEELLQL